MLQGSGAFDELGFEDVVRSIFRWAEEEISDFCGELWTERADNVVELRLLRSDAASGELSLDLGEPNYGVRRPERWQLDADGCDGWGEGGDGSVLVGSRVGRMFGGGVLFVRHRDR